MTGQTTLRVSQVLLDFFEGEARRTELSRSAVIEHYLLEGMRKGDRPLSKDERVKDAIHKIDTRQAEVP